ncbi:MAG: hypothetical protein SNJ60_08275 [Pseudanabaenaceae cyanobacterium]
MKTLLGLWLLALIAAGLIRWAGTHWPTPSPTPQLQAIALWIVLGLPLALGLVLRART